MAGTVVNPTQVSQGLNSSNILDSLGKSGEVIDANLHAKYYEQTYGGTMFYATTVAATAPAIYTATAVTGMSIWNPTGSGKNIVLAKIIISKVTAAAAAPVQLGFALIQNAGSGVATGGPISATTALSSALRGGGLLNNSGQNASIALVSTGSTVVAPTQFVPLFGMTTDVITTSSEGTAFVYDPEGSLILQPGSYIAYASNVANTGTCQYALYWYEDLV
jgi:hypothetical protein